MSILLDNFYIWLFLKIPFWKTIRDEDGNTARIAKDNTISHFVVKTEDWVMQTV